MATDQRIRELARAHLSYYSYADAIYALIEIAGRTEPPVSDELLVQAARRHLETVDAGGEVDPYGALRELATSG